MVIIKSISDNKTYPLKYLAELFNEITNLKSINILLNYTRDQKSSVQELLSYCSENSKICIHEDIFCNSLRDFLALLNQCNGYFGNEGRHQISQKPCAFQILQFSHLGFLKKLELPIIATQKIGLFILKILNRN